VHNTQFAARAGIVLNSTVGFIWTQKPFIEFFSLNL